MKKLFSFSILAILLLCSQVGFARENYLKVTNTGTSSCSFRIKKSGTSAASPSIWYSTNNSTWTEFTFSSSSTTLSSTVSITAGSSIYLKANLTDFNSNPTSGNYCYFNTASTGCQLEVTGNILALIDGATGTATAISDNVKFAYLFYNCTVLKSVDENLFEGISVMKPYALYNMFLGCSSLVSIPKLPATVLASYCYYGLFKNCSSLQQTPNLPATTLASYCYSNMFSGCTALTQAPTLPATTLASYCYNNMFYGCTALTQAPTLPATTLATNCYSSMFYGCTALTQAPSLPATTLANNCYEYMFYGCTLLTQAPELLAEVIPDNAYSYMFNNCVMLASAPNMSPIRIGNYGCQYMFYGCSSLTATPDLTRVEYIGSQGCYQMFYNCIALVTACDLNALTVGDMGYQYMFKGCLKLENGPTIIKANPITQYTCSNMFADCSSLEEAPAISAATIETNGLASMFANCYNLKKAPELPATTIATYCYSSMFLNCYNMTTSPTILPATKLYSNCYQSMFEGCTNLITTPELPATTIAMSSYEAMFKNCTKLKRAPVINISTIYVSSTSTTTYDCSLKEMFYGCSSLSYIEVKFTQWATSTSSTKCATYNWVYGVAADGVFVKPTNLTDSRGVHKIPEGWTLGSDIVYTFDLQGLGTWDGTNSDTKQFYSPQPTTEPAVVPNKGYMFTKWNDKADGSGSDFNVSSKPGVSTTFFAQYGTVSEFEEVSWTASSVVIKTTLSATNAKVQVFGSNSSIENGIASCQLAGDAGVYNLTFPSDLLNAAGQFAIISFTNGGTNIGNFSVRIPNLVTAAKTASQLPVNTELDTWVCNGATLTVDMNSEYKNVYVAGGAKLVVPSGKTLTAKNLFLRAGGITNGTYQFRYPQLVANGSVNVASSNVYYEYLLNNAQFYSFSLPYTVNVNAITYLDNSPATFYFGAQQYNGEIRKSGNTTGWEYLWNPKEPVATYPDLQANKGYTVFGVPQKVTMEGALEAVRRKYCYLRFPLNADLTNGEAVPGTTKDIPVFAYGMTNNVLDDGVRPNDAGWNLVGNPYMADFNSIDGLTSTNGIGLLTQSGEGYIWTGTLRYIVIPNDNGTVYTPYLASGTDAAVIPAFKNYFVQIGTGDALQFAVANRIQQAPAEMLVDNEIMTGLQVSGNGKADDIALLISDEYTSNYEINADLAKWMNNGLNLYATVGGYNLSVAAMDAASAEKAIPVTIQTTAKGTYTFALSNKWSKNIENIEHLYLYDAQTQTYTDIKNDNYSFQAANAGVINNRFFVSATGAKSPTILDNTRACMILPGDGVISLRGLDNQTNVSIYNGAGARVFGAKVNVNTIDIPLSQGVYVVNVENNGKTSQKTCLVF